METNVAAPTDFNWKEVIPHRDDVLLEDIDIFSKYMVVSERINGLAQLRVMNQADNTEHYLEFDEDAYLAYATDNHEFDTDILRFRYTSMKTPYTTYDYNMLIKTPSFSAA